MEKLSLKERKNYEVIKKWNDKLITFKSAQLQLGYSEQHMYRLKKLLIKKGKDGFVHGNKGRKPNNTIDQPLSDTIVHYYKTEYQDYNFRHFQDALKKDKNIDMSYAQIYDILTIHNKILSPRAHKKTRKDYKKKELLAKKENKNKSDKELDKLATMQISLEDATPRLPQTYYFGQNIEIDASSYNFFGNIKSHLHLSIDAATDTCTGAFFDYQETLYAYYHVLFQILVNHGIPLKITSDGRTIFEYISKKMKTDEKAYFTQFKHACDVLGIELFVTSKSQKKPRVERYNQFFQDRLSHELHHLNITTIEDANKYLINTFIPNFNKQFAKIKRQKESVFETLLDKESLNFILAVLSIRSFDAGNSIHYKGKIYLPYDQNNQLVCYRKGTECTVIEAFDGKMYAQIYNEVFSLKVLQETLNPDETIEDYYQKIKENNDSNKLPKPKSDWDKENLDDIFENINKEYNIYDSHNPKVY